MAPHAMNQKSALSESLKRTADLAIGRFGADPTRVEITCKTVLEEHALGRKVELLDALVAQNLITSSQAKVLRDEMAETSGAAALPQVLAAPSVNRDRVQRSTGAGEPEVLVPTSSGYHLQTVGEYRLLRRLGQGGMGSVYLGFDEVKECHVAVKVLSDQLASDRNFVERFHREAKSGMHLNHPNIVRCLAEGQEPATLKHYLVLEFIDGPSAQALIELQRRLAVADAVRMVLDVAKALEYAHSRNVIHRDVKPDNILVTLSGIAKLADFGLAKRLDEASHLTELRQGFGSLYYVPWEQAFNAKFADVRCDIYSLGATFYHLLTGDVPFNGSSHLEIAEKKDRGLFATSGSLNPQVPPILDMILGKMLARDPEDRYQLVSEAIVDLERSGLAAPVLSFADHELALRDPLVQARLTAPSKSTQLDLAARLRNEEGLKGKAGVWYLRFRNGENRWCKTKLTTEQILDRLLDGRLPAGVEVSRLPQGEFRSLAFYAEFRGAKVASKRGQLKTASTSPARPDSAAEPSASEAPPTKRRRRWFFSP